MICIDLFPTNSTRLWRSGYPFNPSIVDLFPLSAYNVFLTDVVKIPSSYHFTLSWNDIQVITDYGTDQETVHTHEAGLADALTVPTAPITLRFQGNEPSYFDQQIVVRRGAGLEILNAVWFITGLQVVEGGFILQYETFGLADHPFLIIGVRASTTLSLGRKFRAD